jgi:hypothetical protein
VDSGDEGAGGAELARAGAHGEAAAHRDQVGRVGAPFGRERLHHRLLGEEEVQVGDVGDAAHAGRTAVSCTFAVPTRRWRSSALREANASACARRQVWRER